MTLRNVLLFGLICVLSMLFSETAQAHPKSITFEALIEVSATIVVAKSAGEEPDEKTHTVHIDVIQVLKGDLKPGKLRVSFEDSPHFGDKSEFIAFLDKDRVWRFVASPSNHDNKVDSAVLNLSGFYDFNAYFVSPGLITFDQLKAYLKDGSLVYRFQGEVYFPEVGKADRKAGTFVVSGTYDAMKKKADVKCLPNLQGFPDHPEVHIQRSTFTDFDLLYDHPEMHRFSLIGKVQGFDKKSGEMKVRFAVSGPDILTQKTFEEYLADTSKSSPYYKFKLTCIPVKDNPFPKVLYLTMGKWANGSLDSTTLEGIGKGPLQVCRFYYSGPTFQTIFDGAGQVPPLTLPKTMVENDEKEDAVWRMTFKTEAGDYLTVGFDVGEVREKEGAFAWSFQNHLLSPLYRNPTKGSITLHNETESRIVATFETTLDAVEFNRIEKK